MSSHGLVDTERLRNELLHLLSLQRIEPPNGKAAETQERLLRAAQRDVRIPLSFVVCTEKNDSLARDLSRDEVQQLERRCVSPLKILEYDEERLLRREPSEKLGKVPEQARLYL